MRVRDLMNKSVVTVLPTMTLKEAAVILDHAGTDKAFVVDQEGKLIGLISQIGFIKALATSEMKMEYVRDIMIHNIVPLLYTKRVDELPEEFVIHQCAFFPVIDTENYPLGILYQTDVVTYLSEKSLFLV